MNNKPGARVLVIDRDRDLVELVAFALRRAGIDFLAANDAASALETFAAQRPQVVVMDPNGLDVLQNWQLRGDDGTAIIILTAGESDDACVAAMERGADDHLTKPFSCKELVASVHACLLRHGNRVEKWAG